MIFRGRRAADDHLPPEVARRTAHAGTSRCSRLPLPVQLLHHHKAFRRASPDPFTGRAWSTCWTVEPGHGIRHYASSRDDTRANPIGRLSPTGYRTTRQGARGGSSTAPSTGDTVPCATAAGFADKARKAGVSTSLNRSGEHDPDNLVAAKKNRTRSKTTEQCCVPGSEKGYDHLRWLHPGLPGRYPRAHPWSTSNHQVRASAGYPGVSSLPHSASGSADHQRLTRRRCAVGLDHEHLLPRARSARTHPKMSKDEWQDIYREGLGRLTTRWTQQETLMRPGQRRVHRNPKRTSRRLPWSSQRALQVRGSAPAPERLIGVRDARNAVRRSRWKTR